MAAPQPPPRGESSTGICGCFEDRPNYAFTAGRNYLVLFNLVPVFGATLYGCTYRAKLRRHFVLPEQPCRHCGDCFVHNLCCFCALCQEHRELTNREMDPRGGWRKEYETIMNPRRAAPTPEQGMAHNYGFHAWQFVLHS